MSRKKVTRSKPIKNAKVKQKVKRVVSSLSEAMEKDFNNLPKQLPIQFAKDIAALKKREAKLAATIKKMEKQRKAAKTHLDSLTAKLKNKSTPAIKKQLKSFTRDCHQIDDILSGLQQQLKQAQQQIEILSDKQEKFSVLSKEILKLDKNWEKNKRKSASPIKQTRKKRINKTQSTSLASEIAQSNNPMGMPVSMPAVEDTVEPMEETHDV